MRGKRGVLAVTFSVLKNAPDFWDLFFWGFRFGLVGSCYGGATRFVLSRECQLMR
jgi:hypothetical protein